MAQYTVYNAFGVQERILLDAQSKFSFSFIQKVID